LCAPPCQEERCPRFWGGADYLLWWTKGSATPPLLIGGPAPLSTGPIFTGGPVPTSPGFIGLFNFNFETTTLNLNTATTRVPTADSIDLGLRTGARFTAGGWLDCEGTIGLEGSYFFLASRTVAFGAGSFGAVPLAIPFIDPTTGREAGYPISQPFTTATTVSFINTTPAVFVHLFDANTSDAYSGKAIVVATSRLQGYELNAVASPDMLGKHLQLLAGFRYAQLDEGLGLTSSVLHEHHDNTLIEPFLGLPNGNILNSSLAQTTRWDQFDCHNNFYGAQVGARGDYTWGRLSVMGSAKLAMGTMDESVQITGLTNTTTTATVTPTRMIALAGIPLMIPTGEPAVTTTTTTHTVGGLFAQRTNIGLHSRSMFEVVPEANLKVGYQVTDYLRATVGYTFLYMSNVARPGIEIDRFVNPGLLASPPVGGAPLRPLFQFKGTDYWAQGIDFGLEFRF
jgi:hypothetical protein